MGKEVGTTTNGSVPPQDSENSKTSSGESRLECIKIASAPAFSYALARLILIHCKRDSPEEVFEFFRILGR